MSKWLKERISAIRLSRFNSCKRTGHWYVFPEDDSIVMICTKCSHSYPSAPSPSYMPSESEFILWRR